MWYGGPQSYVPARHQRHSNIWRILPPVRLLCRHLVSIFPTRQWQLTKSLPWPLEGHAFRARLYKVIAKKGIMTTWWLNDVRINIYKDVILLILQADRIHPLFSETESNMKQCLLSKWLMTVQFTVYWLVHILYPTRKKKLNIYCRFPHRNSDLVVNGFPWYFLWQ